MSKLIERLSWASVVPQPMGFGRVQGSPPKPKMVLIASPASAANLAEQSAGADAGLLVVSSADAARAIQEACQVVPGIPWGARAKDPGHIEADELVKAGADFIIFMSETSLALGGDVGRILEIEPAFDQGLLAAANRLSIDALLVSDPAKGGLTWRRLMALQRFADIFQKPLLAWAPPNMSADEVKALWDAGVDGVVVESGVKELRQVIDGVTFAVPRRRAKREAILPHVESRLAEPEEEEEEDE